MTYCSCYAIMAVIYYFFVGKLKMKKSKALKVILAILLAVLVIGGVCVFAFYKYFTAPIGKYPDKAQRAEFIKHPSVLYNDGEGRFYNENPVESTSSSSLNVNGYSKPESLIPAEKIDSLDRSSDGEMNISWLGHSSVLVQMGSQNVLIDPILTKGATTPQMYTLPARICARYRQYSRHRRALHFARPLRPPRLRHCYRYRRQGRYLRCSARR